MLDREPLCNKYRPRKLADLVGQPAVVTSLSNEIEADTLHHAYLFHGNLGCGKTSVARVLAAMVNCEKGPTVSPCGTCKQCISIFNSQHQDVQEIDAASSGKIDHIRELRKDAYFGPIGGARKKIYIIDEFHRCSPDAEEACLRIMEEPPSHVMFILCTTEFHQMRPTIISRCQTFVFRKIFWNQIFEHLKIVAARENVVIEDSALKVCALAANGSMRNALQNLDKLIAFAKDGKITAEIARQNLGMAELSVYQSLLSCVINDKGKPETTQGYKLINNVIINSENTHIFLQGLDEYLRCLLIALTAPDALDLLSLSDEEKKRVSVTASRFSAGKVDKILTNLNDVYRCLDYGVPIERLLNQWFVKSVLVCHIKKEA